MTHDWFSLLISGLLGTGGAAGLISLIKGYNTLRTGVSARRREAYADLSRARDAADERAYLAEADRDFWRDVAGTARWQLRQAGIDPGAAPVPPSKLKT